MAHVILFEHAQFHGQHKHVFGAEPNLNAADDNYFNDKVSSLVVLEGNWAVFADSKFQKQYPPILGPGLYPVLPAGVKNDDMSSLKPVDTGPTVFGDPVNSHVMLFEHANFHGGHKHVFTREPNLNGTDDNYFNDRSLVIGGACRQLALFCRFQLYETVPANSWASKHPARYCSCRISVSRVCRH